jgi:TonB family protein
MPGNGVSAPSIRHEVRPQYTSEAMALVAQGVIWLQCVVLADGTVGDVTVLRSLWPDLDANAIAAVRQ